MDKVELSTYAPITTLWRSPNSTILSGSSHAARASEAMPDRAIADP
ncbi:MAG: hypothetical protein KME23_19885 [Goleter apudmare HA4340-LM2]|nr:hypothetical protein [Goleter apudmare HA4340-LM2]